MNLDNWAGRVFLHFFFFNFSLFNFGRGCKLATAVVVGHCLHRQASRCRRCCPPADGDYNGALLDFLEQADGLLVGHALDWNAINGEDFIA